MRFTGKAVRYAREARFAWSSAADAGSRLKLVVNSLRFHFSNVSRPSLSHEDRPERYAMALSGRRFPLELRTRGGDLFVFYEVFLDGCYRLGAAAPEAGRPIRVVDLGANVGLTSLYYGLLHPGSRFVCVEPKPSNARILASNVAWLDAKVIEAAVGPAPGRARFDAGAGDWGGALKTGASEPGTIDVRVAGMDEILLEAGFDEVDVLKVDIEGAEKELFRGTPGWLRKVRRIVIEFHPGYGVEEFRRDVGPAGFTVYESDTAGNPMTVAVRP